MLTQGPQESGSVQETLDMVREVVPQTTEDIELLFIILEDFEGSDFYAQEPDQINYCVDEDLDEIAEELVENIKRELAGKDEHTCALVRDAFTTLHHLLSQQPNVYKYFLSHIFEYFSVTTHDFEPEKEVHVYNKYRVPNLNLKRQELEDFYIALGLAPNTKGGKGSHIKWTDPNNEMQGSCNSSDEGALWVKNNIKSILAKGMPIERIEAACKVCNISFQRK